MRSVTRYLICAAIVCGSLQAQVTNAATFGKVVQLGYTPTDMALDESRQQIYLVNSAANRIDVFSTAGQAVTGSVNVGNAPLAVAISMDGASLYVTNSKSASLSVIDLTPGSPQLMQSVSLPAVPEGVEVGLDGRVLIGTQGTNSLLIFDRSQISGQQLTAVFQPPTPSTPAPLPGTITVRPQTAFNSKLIRTPDGQFIVGLTNPGNNGSQTYLFVYEVASGTVLRSRLVAGQSTTLSISPDGARFMAGYTMYDTSTLSVIAQQNNANAPFSFTNNFSAAQNTGGSAFSPDGATIYSAFNVAPFTGTNPPPATQASTLLINDSRNLGIQLGIRMPESIVSKIVTSADGSDAWSLSSSGMIYLPLSTLYNYPIIQPETTQVFLASDPCHRGLASATVKINNIGAGKLTFAVNSTHVSLAARARSGLAPSNITFTAAPQTGVLRQSGTNLTSSAETILGIPVDITLSSNEAINVPSVIRVYMNQRDADQRGIIYPVPTVPNNSPASAANPTFTGGNEGLQDILLDEPRGRIYLSNSGYNRLEVFDTVNRVFLDPIIVGQLPHQMALSTDGNTLYVGNTGGELISIVDLSQNRPAQTGYVNFPPIPRQAGGTAATLLNPRSLAYGLFGLQFIMSNGGQWKLSTANVAVPRPADNLTPATLNLPTTMVASPDATTIFTLGGTDIGYVYQSATDSYVSRQSLLAGFNTTTTPAAPTGYFGALAAANNGSYYLESGEVLNSSLTPLAGNQNASATQRNVAGLWAYDADRYLAFTTSFRSGITAVSADEQRPTLLMSSMSSGTTRLIGVAPEQPRYTFFGTTRTNVPARTMAVDSAGTAYLITLSGLTVMPLTLNGAAAPVLRSVVNSTGATAALRPGSFVTVSGSGMAGASLAQVLPAPLVLGGSCVTFNDVTLPLFQTAPGQIQAQIPAGIVTGANVVVVRSLENGTSSNPVVVTVLPAGSGN